MRRVAPGSTNVLDFRESETPVPNDNAVLVLVHAAGLAHSHHRGRVVRSGSYSVASCLRRRSRPALRVPVGVSSSTLSVEGATNSLAAPEGLAEL